MNRSFQGSGKVEDSELEVSNLLWSDEEYKITDFVDKFPLPQIVKVQEGYYGPDEDSCLGAEQVLTIHAMKHAEKVLARDRRRRELHIPLNCSRKVEERPSNLKDIYEKVSEVARLMPRFVRVTLGYYSLEDESSCINPGDKLELQKIIHEQKESVLLCTNQERFPVRLGFDVVAGFQPLVDGREYYLKELVSSTKLPFYFQFVDPPNVGTRGESQVFNSTLGVLRCEKVYTDSTIMCSTKEGRDRTVVTFPKDLQVTVAAAQGALIGDNDYMRVCRFFHDGLNLTKIENMDTHNVFASRNTIREYLYQDTLLTPPSSPGAASEFPTESHVEISSKMSGGNHDDDDDDDDDDYVYHDYTYIADDDYDRLAKQRSKNNNGVLERDNTKEQMNKTESKQIPEATPLGNEGKNDEGKNDEGKNDEGKNDEGKNDEGKNGDAAKPITTQKVIEASTTVNNNGSVQEKPFVQPELQVTRKHEAEPMAPIPDDLSELSIEEVSQVLEQVHLQEFVEKFEYNQIDGDLLTSLDEEVLQSLGMNAFQRKKLLKLIGGWRPKQSIYITKL